MSRKHLTPSDRDLLAEMVHQGHKQVVIAEALKVHQSTISRELGRNASCDGYYRPYAAQCSARTRRREALKRRPRKMENADLRVYVQEHLEDHWSPEQIAGRLKRDGRRRAKGPVSHETIYAWIRKARRQGQQWHLCLRQGRRKRHRRSRGKADGRGQIPNRTSIEERPAGVAGKRHFGHWESDTLVGQRHQGSVISHVERKSQYLVLAPLPERDWRQLIPASQKAFARHGRDLGGALPLKTTTVDNGQEFRGHEEMKRELGLRVYFAHPHHPWERGLGEQVNGLIRQYLPKGRELKTVDVEQLRRVEVSLNNRPRKTLGYRTPLEVLRQRRVYASRI